MVHAMLTATQAAENYFLESRHMLLEVAAHFDRYDAARGREAAARGASSHANGRAAAADAAARKLAVLREALAIVADPAPRQERTVSLLELFARS
jgi:hypothetical protein